MNKNETIEKIKAYRIKIDMLTNSIKTLTPSRPVSLAITDSERAKMWLGKVLGELGNPTPYPQSDTPESPVIEPQAEHSAETVFNDSVQGHVPQVKFLRAEIDKLADSLLDTVSQELNQFAWLGFYDTWDTVSNKLIEKKVNMFFDASYLALTESRMWLGMELDRVRSTKK